MVRGPVGEGSVGEGSVVEGTVLDVEGRGCMMVEES